MRKIAIVTLSVPLLFCVNIYGNNSVGVVKYYENTKGVRSDCCPSAVIADSDGLTFEAPAESEVALTPIFASKTTYSQKSPNQQKEMVYLSSTTLDLGDRTVQVRGFYIDKYEVTNQEYNEFIQATGHNPPISWKQGIIPKGKENQPVVSVTFDDAVSYAKWVGKRLPTEAEWEVAALRAADNKQLANFSDDSNSDEMVNVAEWTSSPYHDLDSHRPPGSKFLTIRRGACKPISKNVPLIDRAPMHAKDCNSFTGFRCVKDSM